MKDFVDRHLDSAMFFLAIIGMLFTFYCTNSTTNSRIDSINSLVIAMQKENADYHADVKILQQKYYDHMINREK